MRTTVTLDDDVYEAAQAYALAIERDGQSESARLAAPRGRGGKRGFGGSGLFYAHGPPAPERGCEGSPSLNSVSERAKAPCPTLMLLYNNVAGTVFFLRHIRLPRQICEFESAKNYASLLPHGWIWCAMRFKCHQVDAHPPPSRNGNTYLQRAMYIGQPTGFAFMVLWIFNIRTLAVGGVHWRRLRICGDKLLERRRPIHARRSQPSWRTVDAHQVR